MKRLLVLAVLLLAVPASAALPPGPLYETATVSIVGCSQGRHIFWAYDNVTVEHRAFDDAHGNYHLAVWATEGDAWAKLDSHVAQVEAVFFPLCIRVGSYASNKKAWDGFLAFHALLRLRTQAPLWLSATNGSQPNCPGDNDAQQQHVFNRAVAAGMVARSMLVPTASDPLPDLCHFDTVLSTNVGFAVRDFLDV